MEPECFICRQALPGGNAHPRFCRCPGDTGRVHAPCLAAWLNTSRNMTCTFCGSDYQYTERVESWGSWLLRGPWRLWLTFLVILLVFTVHFLLMLRTLDFLSVSASSEGEGWFLRVCVGLAMMLVMIYGTQLIWDKALETIRLILVMNPRRRTLVLTPLPPE